MISITWMALVILGLFSVGCSVSAIAPTPPSPATPTKSVLAAGTSPASSIPSPSAPASATARANKQTFRDLTGGYSIDIPQGWTIQDADPRAKQVQRGYYSTFLSWEQRTPWKGEMPAGGTMLQVTVSRWEPLNLGKYVTMRKEAWANSKVGIVSQEEWTLPGNLPATRFILKSDKGNELVLFTLIKDHFLTVSGAGDLNLVESIARTLNAFGPTP